MLHDSSSCRCRVVPRWFIANWSINRTLRNANDEDVRLYGVKSECMELKLKASESQFVAATRKILHFIFPANLQLTVETVISNPPIYWIAAQFPMLLFDFSLKGFFHSLQIRKIKKKFSLFDLWDCLNVTEGRTFCYQMKAGKFKNEALAESTHGWQLNEQNFVTQLMNDSA